MAINGSALYFAFPPNLSELSVFRAVYLQQNESLGIVPPCCRELIFTEKDLLVSPAFDDSSSLLIVMKHEKASSEEFLLKLKRLKIKLCSKVQMDPELFQFCFTYTFYQKLAPFWNKTSSFVVQGRSFLRDESKIPAVGLEVNISDKICLSLQPFLVKMPQVQIEDFVVNFESLWRFKRDQSFRIDSPSIQEPWCFVLPSWKRGRIDSITHTIPSHAPFKNYQQLRQHWKVTYGYHLPAEDCNVFFNVCFRGKSVFTYPEWCIRSAEPIIFSRCHDEEICASFLSDVATRMPTACGSPINFTPAALFFQQSLQSEGRRSFVSNQLISSRDLKVCSPKRPRDVSRSEPVVPRSSDTRASNQMPPCVDYQSGHFHSPKALHSVGDICEADSASDRNFQLNRDAPGTLCENIVDIPDSPDFQHAFDLEQVVPDVDEDMSVSNKAQKVFNSDVHPINSVPVNSEQACLSETCSGGLSSESFLEQGMTVTPVKLLCQKSCALLDAESHSSAAIARTLSRRRDGVPESHNVTARPSSKLVPTFKRALPRTPLDSSVVSAGAPTSGADRLVPVFKKKFQPHGKGDLPKADKTSPGIRRSASPAMRGERPNVFANESKHLHFATGKPVPTGRTIDDGGEKAHADGKHESASHPSSREKGDMEKPCSDLFVGREAVALYGERSTKPCSSTQVVFNKPDLYKTSAKAVGGVDIASLKKPMKMNACKKLANDADGLKQVSDSALVKMPRAKPKVQDDLDVDGLARSRMLRKVNAVTLRKWLKDRGVAAKSSDKKGLLMEQVYGFLQLAPQS